MTDRRRNRGLMGLLHVLVLRVGGSGAESGLRLAVAALVDPDALRAPYAGLEQPVRHVATGARGHREAAMEVPPKVQMAANATGEGGEHPCRLHADGAWAGKHDEKENDRHPARRRQRDNENQVLPWMTFEEGQEQREADAAQCRQGAALEGGIFAPLGASWAHALGSQRPANRG